MIERIRNLKNNSSFIRYFKNTSWVFSEKIIRIIIALVVGVWVTNYLGPKDFGTLSYAQSFVGLISAFSTLGLNGILVRELVKSPKDKNIFLGTTFLLQTCGSIILLIVLLITIAVSSNDDLTNKIILLLGLITFLQSFNVIAIYFQSQVMSLWTVIGSIVALTVSSILNITLILTSASLIYFVYAIMLESLLFVIGLIVFFHRMGETISKWKFSLDTAKDFLSDSWPLALSGIIVSIYMKIDQVMIKEIIDNQSVGQYAAAVRLSEAWYFVPTVISASLFPAIVNAKKKNEKLYYSRLQDLYDLMVGLALSIALPMTFISDWLVNFLYGKEFYLTGSVLSIHIWAGLFVFLGVSRSNWILNENLQRYTIMYLGIGAVFNIILNLLLIPMNGILGAAWATLISQAISVLFAPLLFKRTRISFYMMIKSLAFVNIIQRIHAK